jgi:hypothetical protein
MIEVRVRSYRATDPLRRRTGRRSVGSDAPPPEGVAVLGDIYQV